MIKKHRAQFFSHVFRHTAPSNIHRTLIDAAIILRPACNTQPVLLKSFKCVFNARFTAVIDSIIFIPFINTDDSSVFSIVKFV